MDHTHAIEVRAAERYLLGGLPAAEAEDFERHYFECADCAQAVEAGGQFIANARVVFGEPETGRLPARAETRKSWRDRWRSWWSFQILIPAAAALVLAAVAVYQGFVVIPGLRQTFDSARALPAFQLAGVSRGAEAPITVPAGTPSLALAIDVPPDLHFARYLCVLTAGTRTLFRVETAAPPEGQPITILAPTHGLAAGEYEFNVYGIGADGQPRDKVATSSFQFQFR